MLHAAQSSSLSKRAARTTPNLLRPDVSQNEHERLRTELGEFSAAGIERAAWGWDQYVSGDLARFRDAERAALHGIEKADRGPAFWRARWTRHPHGSPLKSRHAPATHPPAHENSRGNEHETDG